MNLQPALGEYGSDTITNVALVVGHWNAVYFWQDSVLSVFTVANNTVHGTIIGPTIEAGTVWFVNATQVQLASGAVICYRAKGA